MSIQVRTTKDGRDRYCVSVRREGKVMWLGTYPTRDVAEEALRAANPPPRRCAACGTRFTPVDDRTVRCRACNSWARSARAATTDDHWLYRCFDEGERLLYIGITSAGIRRFRRHGNHREWWKDIASIRVEHFETRDAARDAERHAIRDEYPLHNIQDRAA